MARKFYVNMDGGDPAKGEGRVVPLKISATETKPGSAKGQDVFVFVEPDGGNEDATFVTGGNRAQNFQTEPPFCTKVTLEGTSTQAKIQISIAGGDKFGFKVSMKDDGSAAKKAPGEPVEVWRKVFARVGHMADCKHVDPTSLNGKLADVFIEIEKKGALRELTHVGNSPEVGPPIAELDKLEGTVDRPGITAKVAFVDRIMKAGEMKWDFGLTPSQLSGNRRVKVKVNDDKLTWPFDDWLLSGIVYLFDGNGQLMARDPIQNFVSRAKATPSTPKSPSTGKTYEHKEGLATNRLLFDFKKFPNIERWMQEKNGTATVFMGLRTIERSSGGKAHATAPWIIVATRSGWNYNPKKDVSEVLLHEMGHVLGHVLRFIPRFTADTGVADDRDENLWWYDKHGGVGNHCHNGSTLGKDTCTAGKNACVMYHSSSGSGADFCDACKKILKRAPLTQLARVKVWGADAWQENP